MFVELLEEACTDKSKVGRLFRSMYGCQDAGVNWEFAICQVMMQLALCRVEHHRAAIAIWKSSSVCGYTETTSVLLGYIVNVRWFFVKLQEFWVVTNRGILGPSGYHDCVQSIRVLGRIVEWTADGITWEADHRHAELVRKSFAVTGRSVATDTRRQRPTDIEGEVPIDKEASVRYRANIMRAQYLSSDRPDMKSECWDLARKMQQPSNLYEMGLKRLARFLGVRLRLVWLFKWRIVLHESNPGVIRTMQAVSEPVFLVVRRCWVAVPSARSAENRPRWHSVPAKRSFYGLVSATSKMFGLHSILLDWGWKFNARVWMDATAGIAIGSG